ncbi:hypothetical protein Nisw_06590 [Candidatus Nitrosopumilus sp. SW]|uniref:hypothetical protein n=1 Tax=Candidatus Nitrosopumilus sp. SW TaxID=2508726 RepID=UPI001154C443|nr:hypothetical protein [Candidatus Nitrosopumilus sp. SW]QDI89212.1 hypothetical protein Nisw_06590 [Candidatus Nitrosopumilus sp. SW]
MIATPWIIPYDTTAISFVNSALFAILLTSSSWFIAKGIAGKNSEENKEIKGKLDLVLSKLESEKPEVVDVQLPKTGTSDIPNIMKEWEIVIKTQMHFNDLLIKVRTATLSVVLAIFGAAGYSLASNEINPLKIEAIGWTFHPSILIICSGIIILLTMFRIDYGYYFQMLKGAVSKGYEFDDEFEKLEKEFGRKYFGMSRMISKAIGKPEKSRNFVKGFYIIPIISGIVFLLAVLIGYQPPSV